MTFDMPSCGGCRTCEIACSYHHTGEFKPSVSSIKILDKKDESPGRLVLLLERYDGHSIPCDGCLGLAVPFCVEACEEKEKLQEIIQQYPKKLAPRENLSETA